MFLALFLTVDLSRIAADSGGTVGVSAVHIETARRATLHATERFPMASVYKVPIGLAFLSRNPDLDRVVTLEARDIRIFQSPVPGHDLRAGVRLSVGELFDRMLIEGDNTAADYILRLAGGPSAVTAYLRKSGMNGIRVDRSEGELAFDFTGVTDFPPPEKWSLDLLTRLIKSVPRERQRAAAERFMKDPRDTATPDAMVDLLVRIHTQNVVRLLEPMKRTIPGAARIKALLPPGTPVAHRTGNGGSNEGMNSATNDVGIITTPTGHIAIAVFVKGSHRDTDARERTIADIAKALYDEWK